MSDFTVEAAKLLFGGEIAVAKSHENGMESLVGFHGKSYFKRLFLLKFPYSFRSAFLGFGLWMIFEG